LVGDVDVRAALAAGDNNGVQSFTNVDIPGGGNNFVFGFIMLVGDVDVMTASFAAAGDNNGLQFFADFDSPGGGDNIMFGFIVLVGDVNVMSVSFAAEDNNGLQSFTNVDIPGGGDNIVFGFAILVGDVNVMTASFAVGGINVDVRPVLAVRDNNGLQSFANFSIPGGGVKINFDFVTLHGDVDVMTAQKDNGLVLFALDTNDLLGFENSDIPLLDCVAC